MSILNYDVAVSGFLDFGSLAPGPLKRRVRDRKHYEVSYEDPSIKNETEGGYTFTRPRYRRNPLRRTYKFGYTDISPSQLSILEDFWNSVQGGSYPFSWIDYDGFWSENPGFYGQTGTALQTGGYTRVVRFAGPFQPKTMNMGSVTRYNVENITVKEV